MSDKRQKKHYTHAHTHTHTHTHTQEEEKKKKSSMKHNLVVLNFRKISHFNLNKKVKIIIRSFENSQEQINLHSYVLNFTKKKNETKTNEQKKKKKKKKNL